MPPTFAKLLPSIVAWSQAQDREAIEEVSQPDEPDRLFRLRKQ